ncbi:MAG: response regulator, partial [Microcoleus sp. SIO2G3]|nr:response regulator [Microcoleus sp. SIO2G3]
MDGFALLNQIRHNQTLQNVPVIVSSASVFESNQHQSLDAGGDAFLAKPVQADELFNLLQKQLQLEWIYAETSIPSEPSSAPPVEIIVPPKAAIAQLYKLALMGDLKGVLQQADRLDQTSDRFEPFAAKLRQFAKGFQEKELLEFIEQYHSEDV